MTLKIKDYIKKIIYSLIFTIPVFLILIELAYRERGYWAIGGEWLTTLLIFIWRLSE